MIPGPLMVALRGGRGGMSATLADAAVRMGGLPGCEWIERPVLPEAAPVAEFTLPLELCQPQNRSRFAKPWHFAKARRALLTLMHVEWLKQGAGHGIQLPLTGRPIVAALRVSAVPPDDEAACTKQAIDLLTPRRVTPKGRQLGGLGIIIDDCPAKCRRVTWWEKGKPGQGYVWLRVFADPSERRST